MIPNGHITVVSCRKVLVLLVRRRFHKQSVSVRRKLRCGDVLRDSTRAENSAAKFLTVVRIDARSNVMQAHAICAKR